MAEIDTWFVLYCEQDDSHVLVKKNDIICEGSVGLDDQVMFSYPGFKEHLTGTVKGFSDNYTAMENLLEELNVSTKPKREPSFHEGRPRRAAARFLDSLKSKGNGSKNNSSSHRSHKKSQGNGTHKRPLKQAVSSSSEDERPLKHVHKVSTLRDTNDDVQGDEIKSHDGTSSPVVTDKNDSSSSSSEEDADVKALQTLALKLAAKNNKNFDLSLLKGLTASRGSVNKALVSSNSNQIVAGSDGHSQAAFCSESAVKEGSLPKKKSPDQATPKSGTPAGEKRRDSNEKSEVGSPGFVEDKSSGQFSNSSDNEDKSTKRNSKQSSATGGKKSKFSAKKPKREIIHIKFEGESLKWGPTDKNGVKNERLWPDHEAYIPEKLLNKAKSNCGNPSLLTRYLTKAMFTDEARVVCSVSGKPSLTKGQEVPEVRTKLNQEGVEAIVAFVEHRCAKKHWKTPPASTIKQYMGNVLCEERSAKRERELEADSNKDASPSGSDGEHKNE